MSESNPLQPNSPFPDPINPNSIPPHPGPNEFVRSKRSTRNSGSDNKQSMKNTGTSSKVSLGVKKSMEFEGDEMEEIEAKDDEVELNGGINETAVNPSSQGVIGSVDGSNIEATNHGKSHVNFVMVNDSGNCDSSINNYAELLVSGSNGVNTSDKGASTVVGIMPVPFIENLVLNPSLGQAVYMGNTSGKINSDGNGSSNPWPKLSESVGNKGGNNDVELGTKGKDTVMTEKFVQNNVSFASAFKGLTGYGNNKLTKVPVRRNEQEKAYGRTSFARVLIEVDADKELVDNVEVCYASLGRSMQLKVEYAWKPPQCLLCKVFGHDQKTCNKREVSVEERVEMTKVANDSHMKQNNSNGGDREWQEVNRFVNNGASTSKTDGQQNFGYYCNRGGSNNRGRGGFMGRGGMMNRGGMSQRGNKDNNVVKNMNLENNVIVRMIRKVKGSGSKVEVKNKLNKQSDLNTKNKFDVLAKDGIDEVEIGSDEWIQMRKKIDLACDLGMTVADSEKSRWSKDLKKYYEEKCNNKAKGRMMEGLKWRIDKLQKDISYGHTNIAMQAKLKADEMCKEIMKETGDKSCLVCNQDDESHSHMFFSCVFSKRHWERLKPMANMVDVGNDWANVISYIVNRPANNTIWSVIQRLVLGACVYFIWNERNIGRVNQVYRTKDGVFKCIVESMRLKLLGFNLKFTADVCKASELWNIPITGMIITVRCMETVLLVAVKKLMFTLLDANVGIAWFGLLLLEKVLEGVVLFLSSLWFFPLDFSIERFLRRQTPPKLLLWHFSSLYVDWFYGFFSWHVG
ncbi:hypothetical protein CTI12_AA232490 [Artemisia annua]|uniref:Uncharacterized protein n=1 Tax=Artemisia annua TaxID=35608 RepID=A0A2U1NSY4_ARTAN|nr:hypothetical protein CTI12_AA232490 [Artemisia annua]